MAIKRPAQVTLSNGEFLTYRRSCRTATRAMIQLATRNYVAINQFVTRALKIDRQTRREQGNPAERPTQASPEGLVDEEGVEEEEDKDEDGESVHNANWINKALAAELLAATMAACLDDPEEVISPCVLDGAGRPKTFAQGPNGDAWAVYPDFAVLIEVSTKNEMNHVDFEKQVEQAVRHGKALSFDLGKPVYALVVNECDIENHMGLRERYRSFRPTSAEDGDAPTASAEDGDVRPIAMTDRNFLRIFDTIHEIGTGENFQFDAGVLGRALQAVYDGLDANADESVKTAWTSTTIIDALRVQPGLRLSSPSPGT